MRLATINLKKENYNIAKNYLSDEVFKKPPYPLEYYTILGDTFFKERKFLSAFNAYYDEIFLLINQKLNQKKAMEFLKASEKSVLCLLKNREETLALKFINFTLRIIKFIELDEESQDIQSIYLIKILILFYNESEFAILNFLLN